jgi:superfamily I DNA/RNA helicase
MLVVAGPGSGKTRVLAHRIAYAIALGRVRSAEVVAISFTNRSAGELAGRIAGLAGAEAGRGIEVGTFHAVCHRQVRAHASRVGRSGAFSIWEAPGHAPDGRQPAARRGAVICAAAPRFRYRPVKPSNHSSGTCVAGICERTLG